MSLDLNIVSPRCCECNHEVTYASFNITHNLTAMAKAVVLTNLQDDDDPYTLYDLLWRGDVCKVSVFVTLLPRAIRKLEDAPEYYRKFDQPSGWGTYDDFMSMLIKLQRCCNDVPNDCLVRASK